MPVLARPADDGALGLEDPAAVEAPETDQWFAFRNAFSQLESRRPLLGRPFCSLLVLAGEPEGYSSKPSAIIARAA